MYASVRRYTGIDPDSVDEIVRRAEEGFVPIVSKGPGFVAYYIMERKKWRSQGQKVTSARCGNFSGLMLKLRQLAHKTRLYRPILARDNQTLPS